MLIFIPLVIAYVQSELNKVWQSEAITDDPAGVLAADALAPAARPAPPAPPAAAQPQQRPPPPPPPPGGPAQAARRNRVAPDPQLERLERLAALRDSGALSAEEYEAQKAKILDEL